MFKNLQNKKLKGGALYYAIFVMLVLGMLSILLLYYFELTFREDTLFYKDAELNDQLSSTITKISCYPEILPESGHIEMDVFGDGEALIQVSTSRWGLLRKVIATARWKHLIKSKVVLMAEVEESRPALWMPDRNRYVSLVGKSQIIGDVYMSELGLRRANIEGRYFEGSELHEGKMHISEKQMPQIKDEVFNWVQGYMAGDIRETDSIVDFQTIHGDRLVKQSYASNTLVLQSSKYLSLEQGAFHDNILILSSDTIEVWPSVELNDVVLIANVIVFKKGFEGRLQAFAKQSLIVEDNCKFLYPSYIGAISVSPDVEVTIGDSFQFNGGLVCFSNHAEEGKTILSVVKTDQIIGKVYTNGDLKISGKITGSLYCNRFVYQTQRAFYENFMMDLMIDEHLLPKEYASFCVGQELYKLRMVRKCQQYQPE
ncbi:hypothetical protein JCM15548_14369 [Geofilum rubicundum JCM 15548]|uniref:Uncharacterized protein n=2 Tax=Geofilum TaxID=1236988 RepID=A0A0E9M329_9BACT|nr:hypothetical protein JCM15548_14369 [Geofilum rubicundum JCM 15548]